jgi:hypothetical protein
MSLKSFFPNTAIRHQIGNHTLYGTIVRIDRKNCIIIDSYRSSGFIESLKDFVDCHYNILGSVPSDEIDSWKECMFQKSGVWMTCEVMLPPSKSKITIRSTTVIDLTNDTDSDMNETDEPIHHDDESEAETDELNQCRIEQSTQGDDFHHLITLSFCYKFQAKDTMCVRAIGGSEYTVEYTPGSGFATGCHMKDDELLKYIQDCLTMMQYSIDSLGVEARITGYPYVWNTNLNTLHNSIIPAVRGILQM